MPAGSRCEGCDGDAGRATQRMLMAKVGTNEDVLIRNNSGAAIFLVVDLNGWAANL